MAKKKPKRSRGGRRVIDIDVEIGRRVRAQRTLRGLTQTELADAIQLAFQQVQKYENGTNRISAGKLFQIAHFLEVPVASFFENIESETFDGSDDSHQGEYRQLVAFAKTANGQRIYRAFSKIKKKETQRTLLRMVETLCEEES
jgi:transcriptional regulator with XRE-family HTH domain